MQLCSSFSILWPFFGTGMKTDLFQSRGHCWVFQICWHIECSTFTVLSFRIWNSSTGIPSPPLALFVVMLPKAHLTLHSRMSGSRWVITPSWLSWVVKIIWAFSVPHLRSMSEAFSVSFHTLIKLCAVLERRLHGAGAAMRRYPMPRGKWKAPARW